MTTCSIKSCNSVHDPILLGHNHPIVIGRGPLTQIKDKRLSRNHVELNADCCEGLLTVKLVGPNKCVAGNEVLFLNQSARLKHGDVLELLEGKYPYRVQFDPVPNYARKENREAETSVKEKPVEKSRAEEKPVKESPTKVNPEMVGKQTTIDSFLGKRKSESADVNQFKKQKTENIWEEIDGGKMILFSTEGVKSKAKIAAFDMDGTIITTQSGKVFPTNFNDWKIIFSQVPAKLKELIKDDYKVVFLTNQAGLGSGKVKPAELRQKLSDITSKLSVPVQVFVSPKQSIYRKPATGMWNYLVNQANDGIAVDMSSSFYCGDAAGREAKWAPGKKKDHSSADRFMAENLGLTFYTPEEYFLAQRPVAYKEPSFNARAALQASGPLLDPPESSLTSPKQEVIVLVGYPGSGKSHFSSQHAAQSKYDVINRDLVGSWQKCVALMERSLDKGQSVLIDNTNPDRESRSRFLKICAARRIPCRCFYMKSSLSHAQHNNKFRELTDEKHTPIPRMVFNVYKSKYQEPSVDEGFAQLVGVNFRCHFPHRKMEELYRMHLLDE